MANERKPSLYVDRGTIGSSDELDEYGVWVKSEPQDISSPGSLGSDDDFAVPEMDDFPDFDDLEAEISSSYGKAKSDEPIDMDFSNDLDNLVSLDTDIKDDDYNEISLHDLIGPIDDSDSNDLASSKDLSTQLLMKIANELTTIRAELSSIKKEFSNLSAHGADRDSNFFGSPDDEKIVLTGDEMDNILNNTDFSEPSDVREDAENYQFDDMELDDINLDLDEADTEADTNSELESLEEELDGSLETELDDELETLESLDEELDGSLETELDDELETLESPDEETDSLDSDLAGLLNGEIESLENPDNLDDELDALASFDSEVEETESEDTALGLDDLTDMPDLDDLEFDTLDTEEMPELDLLDSFDTVEESTEEEIDTSIALEELSDDLTGDLLEESETTESKGSYDLSGYENLQAVLDAMDIEAGTDTEAGTDIEAGTDEIEVEQETDLTTDFSVDLSDDLSLDEEGLDLSDLETETDEIDLSDLEPIELDIDEPNFTDLGSIDFEDAEELEVESEDGNDLSLIPEAMEPVIDEPDLDLVSSEPAVRPDDTEISPLLKEELKSVLSYMDQLLESLPDEKIEEFARSEYFETYKKLFKELGIV